MAKKKDKTARRDREMQRVAAKQARYVPGPEFTIEVLEEEWGTFMPAEVWAQRLGDSLVRQGCYVVGIEMDWGPGQASPSYCIVGFRPAKMPDDAWFEQLEAQGILVQRAPPDAHMGRNPITGQVVPLPGQRPFMRAHLEVRMPPDGIWVSTDGTMLGGEPHDAAAWAAEIRTWSLAMDARAEAKACHSRAQPTDRPPPAS
ncbi:MAG: hypothetical protein IH888_04270 [Planctomycetes bacterium]|nr:hypothetical protein [Planctomycetota bacterium]